MGGGAAGTHREGGNLVLCGAEYGNVAGHQNARRSMLATAYMSSLAPRQNTAVVGL